MFLISCEILLKSKKEFLLSSSHFLLTPKRKFSRYQERIFLILRKKLLTIVSLTSYSQTRIFLQSSHSSLDCRRLATLRWRRVLEMSPTDHNSRVGMKKNHETPSKSPASMSSQTSNLIRRSFACPLLYIMGRLFRLLVMAPQGATRLKSRWRASIIQHGLPKSVTWQRQKATTTSSKATTSVGYQERLSFAIQHRSICSQTRPD